MHASPRTATAATTGSGSASASPSPTAARCRSSSRAGRLSSPSPATPPQALPLPHLLLGRPHARRRHRPAGPLQAAGEAARPGPHAGPAGRDPPAPARAPSPAGAPCCRRGIDRMSARSWPAPRVAALAAAAGAASILLPPGRLRARAMLVALVLFPVLILGDQWHSAQIVDLRDHPARLVALGVARGSSRSAALAVAFRRWPIAAPAGDRRRAPFRVPAARRRRHRQPPRPLYLVIAGGVLAVVVGELGARRGGSPRVARQGDRPTARGSSQLPPGRDPARRRCPADRRCGCPRSWPRSSSSTRAGAVLAGLLQGAAERLLLLRAVLAGLRAAARRRHGTGGCCISCSWVVGCRGGALRRRRLGRVRDPEPVLERPGDPLERIPHLLPRQLGLLGPEHLRALPGAGDRGRDVGAAVGARAPEPGAADRPRRRPLARPRADLLPVELRRPAGRPRGPRGAALEPELDGVAAVAGGGRRRARRPLAGGAEAQPLDRLNVDTSGRANLVSGGVDLFARAPALRLRLRLLPERLPRARQAAARPQSPSPTPSRSPSPPSRA